MVDGRFCGMHLVMLFTGREDVTGVLPALARRTKNEMRESFGEDIRDTSTGTIAIKTQKVCFGNTKDFGIWLLKSLNQDKPDLPVVDMGHRIHGCIKTGAKVFWNQGVPVAPIDISGHPKYVSYLTVRFPVCNPFYVYGATPEDMANSFHRIILYHEFEGNPCKDLFQWAANHYTNFVQATDYFCITVPSGTKVMSVEEYLEYNVMRLKRAADELRCRGYEYTEY